MQARILSFVAAVAFAATACTDSPGERAAGPIRSSVTSGESTTLVARSVALALASSDLRQALVEDMRDNPVPRHPLHLRSYLSGRNGGRLAAAAASRAGLNASDWMAMLDGMPALEIIALRPLDRVRWQGTGDVLVGMTLLRQKDFRSARDTLIVFTTGGSAVALAPDQFVPSPLLLIRPAESPFASDPEGARLRAPHQNRSTISTPMEEYAVMSTCDPLTQVTECADDPPQGGGGPVGYFTDATLTYNQCAATGDTDGDGFLQACEYQLAALFAPQMATYPVADGPNTRETYWSARPDFTSQPNAVKIFYAVSWYADGGEVNTGYSSHYGDSEFIILTVVNPDPNYARWELASATLSAHWGTAQDATGIYSADALEYSDNYKGRPRIWAARSKHGNYRSKAVCDDGGFLFTDTCDDNQPETGSLFVASDRNLGNFFWGASPVRLKDCTRSVVNTYPGTECFWTNDRFQGWQGRTPDSSGYKTSLSFFYF